MKYIKYFLILTIVAVGISMVYTKAYNYPAPLSLPISVDLKPNESYNVSRRSKTTDTIQYYENQYTYTDITAPCSNCKILATLYNDSDGVVSKVTTQMEETKSFNNSILIDNYYLTLERLGVTLMTTHHIGIWYISKNP